MSPLAKSLIAFALVFGGALLGIFLRTRIPDKYQASDSKDVVRLAMGLVVTTVALVLGLLVGSAKGFYDTQNAEMADLGASYLLLDRMLSQYGPEASDVRAELRNTLAGLLGTPSKNVSKSFADIKSGAQVADPLLLNRIWQLSPKDDNQRVVKQQSMAQIIRIGQIRWLIFTQNVVPFPGLLLTMLICWLIMLFMSFGIFAPRNLLVLAGLFTSAAAVCGAILLILEMYDPQSMLIQVSDAPLRAAMAQLGR